jgi:hypothetical protein
MFNRIGTDILDQAYKPLTSSHEICVKKVVRLFILPIGNWIYYFSLQDKGT